MTTLITTLAVVGVIVGLLCIATWCVTGSIAVMRMDEEDER